MLADYPISRVPELWRQGKYPAWHLYGQHHAAQFGVDMDILPFEKFHLLGKLSRSFTGNLDQQLQLLLQLNCYDAIYAMIDNILPLVSWLKLKGLIKTPIITLLHGFSLTHLMRLKWCYDASDRLIATSRKTAEETIKLFHLPPQKMRTVNWWADTKFYPDTSPVEKYENFILSNGKSWRDYPPLFEAVGKIGVAAKFVMQASEVPRKYAGNIEVIPYTSLPMTPSDFLPDLARATVVAVPLSEESSHRSNGITQLMEALASGVPVVMTESPCIDIDIEEEGCGFWVKHGSVDDWTEKLTRITSDPMLQRSMGRNARRIAEKYKVQNFSKSLCEIIKEVA
ncbi:MAG: glycosyltransferase [Rhizobacter sp.]|nr:glycosyltransferase [Chlorobiales bacterium]